MFVPGINISRYATYDNIVVMYNINIFRCNQPQDQLVKQKIQNLDIGMVFEILGSFFVIIHCTICVL
jgi:hypothetical protein